MRHTSALKEVRVRADSVRVLRSRLTSQSTMAASLPRRWHVAPSTDRAPPAVFRLQSPPAAGCSRAEDVMARRTRRGPCAARRIRFSSSRYGRPHKLLT